MKISDLKDGVNIVALSDSSAGPAGTRFRVREVGGEFYVSAPLLADEPFDLSPFYRGKELEGFEVAQ